MKSDKWFIQMYVFVVVLNIIIRKKNSSTVLQQMGQLINHLITIFYN